MGDAFKAAIEGKELEQVDVAPAIASLLSVKDEKDQVGYWEYSVRGVECVRSRVGCEG